MRAVEVTIQNLISDGLDPQLENNPYLCFVYTSFQVGRGHAGRGVHACMCACAWGAQHAGWASSI